jgi:NAD(P)-dependent dehydrogenase (short-subunit alcohol dehydrogenase family)
MGIDILLTGANRGIGLEFARQFSERGDRVVATCRNPAAATELQSLEVEVAALDVTDGAAIEALAEHYAERSFDLLLNSAGVGVNHVPLGELDYGQVERFYLTNTVGPLRIAEALLPALRRGHGKKIASLTSRMGSIQDNTSGGAYAYRASKAALNMVTKTMAIDLTPEGFTCVVLHPGWVQTAMGGDSAPVTIAQSVAGMVRVIDGVDSADSGSFFDYTGDQLPW